MQRSFHFILLSVCILLTPLLVSCSSSATNSFPTIKFNEDPQVKDHLRITSEIKRHLWEQLDHWEQLGVMSIEVKVENISDMTLDMAFFWLYLNR